MRTPRCESSPEPEIFVQQGSIEVPHNGKLMHGQCHKSCVCCPTPKWRIGGN